MTGFAAPLSFAQERLWFLEQVTPGNKAYVNVAAVAIEGQLDVAALDAALVGVVGRHESLRTRFLHRDGVPYQIVEDEPRVSLRHVDGTGFAPADRVQFTESLADSEASRPFPLDAGPLMRVFLIRWSPLEHVFLVMKHHIITDGWSMNVFYRDLAAMYNALVHAEPANLDALPIQYADFAIWQRNEIGRLDGEVEFWRQHLAGAPALLELPAERPRPAVQSFSGAYHRAELGVDVVRAVTRFARANRATPFMVLQAAFASVLGRYARQDDLVLGTPVAGRIRPETEAQIGLYLNTLAIRSDLSGGPSFAELIRRTRLACLAAVRHQQVPFERVVQALRVERQAKHPPLFQVMLAVQNVPTGLPSMTGVCLRRFPVELPASRYDLTASFFEHGDDLLLRLQYNDRLFDAPAMRRLHGHLGTFLRAALRDPQRPIARLPMLDQRERRKVLVNLSSGPPLADDSTLLTRIAEQVRRRPTAVALRCAGAAVSYAALDRAADDVAERLTGLGIGADDVVGICLGRSPRLVTAILGVLRAGAAYVPLDPAYPQSRLEFMLRDAGCRIVIVEAATRSSLPDMPLPRLELGEAPHPGNRRPMAPVVNVPAGPPAIAPTNAYIMYTSGSTGRPKGVVVTRANLTAFTAGALDVLQVSPGDVMLALTSFAFDISVLELLVPLAAGAEVRLVPGGTADVAGVRSALADEPHPTMVGGTPTTWRFLRGQEITWPSGTRLLSGGETLGPDLAADLLAEGAELWNLYGPTEATVYVTAARVEPEAVTSRGPLDAETGSLAPSLGRPIPGSRIYLLDQELLPVPAGVPGEVYIAGRQVAQGYVNRPVETARRFVDDPFTPGSALMYRTGDLARWRAGGELEFLGRIDDQLKLRGFRIEPGDVEAVLTAHPAVAEAMVVVREDRPGDQRLVAYVVPEGRASIPMAELRARTLRALPHYMVPAAIASIDAIPITANGKRDRSALPPIGAAEATQGGGHRSPMEKVLCEMFAEVLHLPEVRPGDGFFELGGHSLLAIQLIGRIQHALAVQDTQALILSLYESPTPAGLAERLRM
ncbi:non-ribosomal peptide synthetase [Micromonospora sp. CA-263727]|uniref:non-ribosomal peptide synthetase n=1 Tax=Micromonospora sp. CA-263727 TaxID=3239967 RepID=UPI003D911ABE